MTSLSSTIPLFLLAALAAGCDSPSARRLGEPQQHLELPEVANLTLYVSNQSFDIDPVDIAIYVDDDLAVTGDFLVEGQHSWHVFDLALEPGNHVLRAVSEVADVEQVTPIAIDDASLHAVINFWYYPDGVSYPEPTPPQFSVTLSEAEPGFE